MQTVQSADGTTIAFDRTGDGPPLLLVGGALADRSAASSLAAALAGNFTTYAYDRRGRGDSGDISPYAVEREIEDLDALITAAGGSALVLGHSSGAVLALRAAAHGLPISRLVVYEPPFVVGDTQPSLTVDLQERVRALIAAGRRGEAVRRFLIEGVGMPAEAVAMMEGSPMWPGTEHLAHTLLYDLRNVGDQRLPADRMARLQVPTLVLSGGESPAWIRDAAGALADAIPGAQHVSLAGQTHAVADDVLVPVLVKFLLA